MTICYTGSRLVLFAFPSVPSVPMASVVVGPTTTTTIPSSIGHTLMSLVDEYLGVQGWTAQYRIVLQSLPPYDCRGSRWYERAHKRPWLRVCYSNKMIRAGHEGFVLKDCGCHLSWDRHRESEYLPIVERQCYRCRTATPTTMALFAQGP